MARVIESPGVEIREVDLSLRTEIPVGTKILVNGFAPQGNTYELMQISTKDELEQVFFGGTGPTNAAERYFYHSCGEVLNSPATLLVTRLPYGSGDGTGFAGDYTALCYPVSGFTASGYTTAGVASAWDTQIAYVSATRFQIGAPTVVPLSESDFYDIDGNIMTWNTVGGAPISSVEAVGNAGFIIINNAKTTIDEFYNGYYLAIADNQTVLADGFDAVSQVNTLSSTTGLRTLDNTLLGFYLTGAENVNPGNISELVENATTFDFTNASYNNSLIMYLFKLRNSPYASDPNKLYYASAETYVGSLCNDDSREDAITRQLQSFYLADKINKGTSASNYIKMYVNPNLANKPSSPYAQYPVELLTNDSKTMNPVGAYTPCRSADESQKYVGQVISKISKALLLAEDKQSLDVDVVLDGGLSTVWTYTEENDGLEVFNDTKDVSVGMTALLDVNTGDASAFANAHKSVFNVFNNFCQNNRKDCIHISDPLRGIFITGEDQKVMSRKDRSFNSYIYTPIKNLYATANSNYSCTYDNWIKIYDTVGARYIWLPFSGWQAAIIARMDANLQPWYAPFGLNNGIVRNVIDIGVKTNQKQQDMLYRIGTNPVVYFQGDGFVVWGQKTLQAKPSAFDRINVRRLFLFLERATLKIMRYFVGEPNTVFTRTRVSNILKPIFDLAKNNEGLYDYMIICDERNNTPDVIDRNEMKVDIYIKPVRTAEFILCTFYATRTDANFSEIIG